MEVQLPSHWHPGKDPLVASPRAREGTAVRKRGEKGMGVAHACVSAHSHLRAALGGRGEQADLKLEVSLGFIARPCLKKKN